MSLTNLKDTTFVVRCLCLREAAVCCLVTGVTAIRLHKQTMDGMADACAVVLVVVVVVVGRKAVHFEMGLLTVVTLKPVRK